jgi:hypothetical protein
VVVTVSLTVDGSVLARSLAVYLIVEVKRISNSTIPAAASAAAAAAQQDIVQHYIIQFA